MEIKDKIKKTIKTVGIVVAVLTITALVVAFTFFAFSLTNVERRESFRVFLEQFGIFGWVILLFIQIFQIIIAIIPGEPIELLAGVVCGATGGLVLCLLGIFIGTLIVYMLVKKFGSGIAEAFIERKNLDRFKFLQDEKKLELLVFLLFFIPGTPKDVLTYFVPLTKINTKMYFIIATLARIPSVITSTLMGDSLAEGNYTATIIVFGVTAVLCIGGIVANDIIMKKKNSK